MGLTVFDAGVLIGLLDAGDTHHSGAHQALLDAWERHDQLALPSSAYSEALVGPSRAGAHAVDEVRDFVRQSRIEIVPIDAAIAEVVARLRQHHGTVLRLPDALVVATAIHLDADTLVTTDRRWPRRTSLGLRGRIVTISASG